jgi:hypothetical protein
VLQLRTCPRCTASFKDGCFEIELASIFKVSLCTLRAGTFAATVTPVRCSTCRSIVGDEPWDYNCVPGDTTLWFDESIIDLLGDARDASGNKFSHQAATATLRSLDERRGSVRQNRRIGGGLKNAQKYVPANQFYFNRFNSFICCTGYQMESDTTKHMEVTLVWNSLTLISAMHVLLEVCAKVLMDAVSK